MKSYKRLTLASATKRKPAIANDFRLRESSISATRHNLMISEKRRTLKQTNQLIREARGKLIEINSEN